ncbi:glycosyltransferase [Kosakonia cowanii]|jgi:glycosyltransferase involved in cell wall biosynthesis|uniref:glycosyltransferase n=1 Tax=Kosakonia cowanii TaxID=208223 RepID=UPI0028990B36|nr:glycosyltransferase [Kosakonia cowanii]
MTVTKLKQSKIGTKLNILHLSTGDDRGAFFGAYRTHINLQRFGHKSVMYVAEKTSNDENVYSASPKKIFAAKLFYKIVRRLLVRRNTDKDRAYLLYGTTFSVKDITRQVKFKPDLIMVYYVSGFLSDTDIEKIQKHYDAPVAFYMMDAGMLTGGCHYPWECTGFMRDCSQCPALNLPQINTLAKLKLAERKALYQDMDCLFLSASKWLDEKHEKSVIRAKLGCEKVLIGIDERTFIPRHRKDAEERIEVKLPTDKIILFVGAQSLNVPRKGYKFLLDALDILKNNKEVYDQISILTVGGENDTSLDNISHTKLKFIKDKSTYPYLYNLADAFICTSIEDAGPMMINESMMSGLPVISFKMGVAQDLIIDNETGQLAENFTAVALAKSISEFVLKGREGITNMKANCRQFALKSTSAQTQVEEIAKIVEKLSQRAVKNKL